MANEFRKAFKDIDKAIKQGTVRALNRALSSTKTQVVRRLRDETGLKTADINARLFTLNARADSLGVVLSIATKVGVALRKFAPLVKKVKVLTKNGRKVTYYGVTAKIGTAARQLIPGAFFLQGKSSDGIVIARKGEARKPTYEPKVAIVLDSAKTLQPDMQKYLVDTFDKNVGHEIEFAIQQKFNENK